jgi:hypothetical protein
MSFSLQVLNGDLVVSGSSFGIVYGTNKLVQDMTLWLAERFGVDRFHPMMGSNFQNYIGLPIGANTQAMVYQEAMRVLTNLQRVHAAGFKASPQRFSLDELLWDINAVNVQLSLDTVNVAVNVSNAVGQAMTVITTQGA